MTIDEQIAELRDKTQRSPSENWSVFNVGVPLIAELFRRLDAAESVVKRLPKSLDGKPLMDGDEIWLWCDNNLDNKTWLAHGSVRMGGRYAPGRIGMCAGFVDNVGGYIRTLEWDAENRTLDCYSTREAALAAKKARGSHETRILSRRRN